MSTIKLPFQETSSISQNPIFMFDTASFDGIFTSNSVRPEPNSYQESAMTVLNSSSEANWQISHHLHVPFSLPPSAPPSFTTSMDNNTYLPPLIDHNVESLLPPMDHHHHQLQTTCSTMNNNSNGAENDELALECLQRHEFNEWVAIDSQQSSNFLFWDHVEGALGGENNNISPSSSNTTTNNGAEVLSSFPSSLWS